MKLTLWMDLGELGCLGVLLIPTYALERDIKDVFANPISQHAEEIFVPEKIFAAKAFLVSSVCKVHLFGVKGIFLCRF